MALEFLDAGALGWVGFGSGWVGVALRGVACVPERTRVLVHAPARVQIPPHVRRAPAIALLAHTGDACAGPLRKQLRVFSPFSV